MNVLELQNTGESWQPCPLALFLFISLRVIQQGEGNNIEEVERSVDAEAESADEDEDFDDEYADDDDVIYDDEDDFDDYEDSDDFDEE